MQDTLQEEPLSKELQYFQRIVVLEKELKLANKQHKPLLQEIGTLQSQLHEAQHQVQELRKQLVEAFADLKAKDSKIHSLKLTQAGLSNRLEQARNDARQLSEFQDMQRKLDSAHQTIKSQREANTQLIIQLRKALKS